MNRNFSRGLFWGALAIILAMAFNDKPWAMPVCALLYGVAIGHLVAAANKVLKEE